MIEERKMHIKRLMDNPDYLAQTTDLLFKEWSSLPSWSDAQQIRARLIERNSTDNWQITLVVIDTENNVVAAGSLICYELNDNPQRMHWLGEVITRPSHRGKGIGTTLVKRLIKYAYEQNIAELWLYTPDMQPLYRKLGWVDEETRIVAEESVTVMVLNINNQ